MATPVEDLTQLTEEFKDVKTSLIDALGKQEEEIKRLGGTTSKTSETISQLEKRYDDLEGSMNDVVQKVESTVEKFNGLDEKEIASLIEWRQKFEAAGGRPEFFNQPQFKSLGQMFTELEKYKAIEGTAKGDGYEGVRLQLQVPDLWDITGKALTSSGNPASAGALIEPFRKPELVTLAQRRLRVRDLLPARQTTTNLIEYVEETGFTNNAAPVAENPENPKPESDLVFEIRETPVRTIAHWIRASRQVLDDANQLQTRIDTQLVYGLEFVVENQILYGSGIGENLQGILTHPNIQSYDMVSDDPTVDGTDTRIDAIRRSMTRVELAFYEATGVVLHPTDWEIIELQKDDESRYIWIVVTEGGVQRLFRLPVVMTPAINYGQGLLGAFDIGAMLWDRQRSNIAVSDQHADFFVKNMVAIRAELRLALEISRPESFVDITFDSGS